MFVQLAERYREHPKVKLALVVGDGPSALDKFFNVREKSLLFLSFFSFALLALSFMLCCQPVGNYWFAFGVFPESAKV